MEAGSITGDRELDRKLSHLAGKAAVRVARKSVNAGMKVVEKEIRAAAPEGRTKGLKKSIGSRNKKNRVKGLAEAKAGIGVGKKNPRLRKGESAADFEARKAKVGGRIAAPHAHLVGMGTQARYTGERSWRIKGGERRKRKTKSKRAFRGRMPANRFVMGGFNRAATKARSVMLAALDKGVEEEARKGAA